MTRKNLFAGVLLTLLLTGVTRAQTEEPLEAMIERALGRARSQALLMARELEPRDGRLPKSLDDDGKLVTSDPGWWCSGFFPGVLWYLYEDSGDEQIAAYADRFTRRLEKVQYITDNHDVGFMLGCSYGHAWRLKGLPEYRQVLLNGAASLATRYDPRIGLIRSWDFNRDRWNYLQYAMKREGIYVQPVMLSFALYGSSADYRATYDAVATAKVLKHLCRLGK